ncbi:MAG TPA: glycosyltransferase family 1 protein [Solirubrobacteraceae bacterium]|nr:glycosyltransferase family 1 protein [Solirubrobacteraceae bacterium]
MSGLIVVNGRAAARAQLGGVERWAREMAARLPALRPGAYAVARPPRALAHGAGQLWEQAALPALAAARRAAVVYSPANLAPLAWPRNALLLHDVAALRHPEWYSPAYVRWQRAVVPRAARRARLLITVSEFSRREIAAATGVDPAGIAVVAGGVGARFRPDADAPAAAAALGLSRPYVLTLSTRYGRKNPGALALAARRLAAEGVDLVAAGGERPYMRAAGAAPGVRSLGYVPDALLPGLFAGARAFAFPSRDEGFGLPVLEALASGTPVVAGDSGALPETCAGAARLVDPGDERAIADAVVGAVADEAERERLRAAGLRRARELTRERAARETDALLAAASEGRAPRRTPQPALEGSGR